MKCSIVCTNPIEIFIFFVEYNKNREIKKHVNNIKIDINHEINNERIKETYID